MPDLAGPFDAATFAQAQWYRDRGYFEPSGVGGTPSTTAAGGDLGLTAAGFALTLALGRAHVRGAAYERTGTAYTTTLPANASSVGPRNDLLVLRRDLTAKTVVPTIIQGTPASSPADPAVTQVEDGVWDLPLHRIQLPASSGTPVTITDLRTWLDPTNGAALGPWLTFPVVGGGFLDHYTAAGAGGGTFPAQVQYRREGNRVWMRGWGLATNGSTAPGILTAGASPLPALFRPPYASTLWVPSLAGSALGVVFRMEIGVDGTLRNLTGNIPAGSYLNFDDQSWSLV